MYIPPFTISSKAINMIAEISAYVERYSVNVGSLEPVKLRRANRIKTIHSSLAIEGNTLSAEEVSEIANGNNVIAPARQIQEVRNAIRTYDLYPDLDPYSIKDLLKAHGVMMEALTDDAGCFRKGGVGVYSGEQAVHIAPQAHMVPGLMEDLFDWLRTSEDHILVKSCVFHYEFEFIHPFSDGNGRMGRLWQSLILGRLHPLFENLPVENMVFANQAEYYEAISKSSSLADSGPFVDYMLKEILAALKSHQLLFAPIAISDNEKKVLGCICEDPGVSAKEMSEQLGISDRQVERILSSLRCKGVLDRVGAKKNGTWILF